MRIRRKFNLIILLLVASSFGNLNLAEAKNKRQVIDLEGADIDGKVRAPTGDYVLQKSGMDFLPLYEKKREMNREIKKTIHFLR